LQWYSVSLRDNRLSGSGRSSDRLWLCDSVYFKRALGTV
jgi:hypothetical protein